jgi:cysteinyl-tRNA synthetase
VEKGDYPKIVPVILRADAAEKRTMPNDRQLRLYNSLGRRLEDFASAGGRTGPYSYGPTVYAYPHLGNMRAYVFADTLRRALRWKGIGVRHVVNITDVGHVVADTDTGEDKLEAAAAARPARRWNAS